MNYKKNVCLLTVLLFLGFIAKAQPLIDLIRDGAKDAFLVDVINDQTNLINECNALLDGQQANGNFKASYANNPFPRGQLNDLVKLCQAYALWTDPDYPMFTLLTGEDDQHNLEELTTGIRRGLNWWYQNVAYYVSNQGWWWNEIGKQRRLQKISVLFYFGLFDANGMPHQLPSPIQYNGNTIETFLAAISADFVTSIADPSNPSGPNDNNTGANKADVAGSIITKGLLENNMDYVDAGKMYLECVMEFSTDVDPTNQNYDGVREDYSFNQHNEVNPAGDRRAFLYSGGFGKDFMYSVATWGAAFNKTSTYYYNYTPEAKANFLNYVMKGYRWMLIGDMTDYSANGRTIAREYPGSNGRITDDEMELIWRMSGGTATTVALSKMRDQLGGNQSFGSKHHKHFWISDYVCHQEGAYFSSLRMCSDRTLGTEVWEGDNLQGFWLPYGATFIYQNGDEYIRPIPGSTADPTESAHYENIFPFWNWSYVPGVTCSEAAQPEDLCDATDPEEDLVPGDNYEDGTYSDPGEANTQIEKFVGNASNDSYGVSAMSFNKDYYDGTVSAKKAWFHFGQEIIALGADIDGNDLYTTVNQCLLDGTVTHANNTNGMSADSEYSGAISWAQHDGIAYIFPESPTVHLSNEEQCGSWNDINGGATGDISGNVFRAWIEHSGNDAQYYYIIAPGLPASTYVNNIQKLSNTTFVQAVRKTISGQTLAGIVFYPTVPNDQTFTPSTVNVAAPNATAINLSTNKSCAVLYDEINGKICISSPNRNHTEVILTVGNGSSSQNITFSLPTGAYAGTSTCINMNFQSLVGNVNSHCIDEEGLPAININAVSANTNVPTINLTTDTDGKYAIPVANTGRLGSNLTITPSNNSNPLNGVSSYDLVLITKHILQTQLLDTPYRRIAADINNSGSITTLDAVALRRLILHIDLAFQSNTSWRFVDADHEFPNPDNPWDMAFPAFPEAITLTPLNLFSRNVDFKGIKIGDVNCSTNPLQIDEGPEIIVIIKDRTVTKDEVIVVPLRVANFSDIKAYQLGISYNATVLEKQSIDPADLNRGADPDNFGLTEEEQGLIRSVWLYNEAEDPAFTVLDTSLVDSSAIFNLTFKAKMDYTRAADSYKLSDLISLNDEVLANRAYSKQGEHNIRLVFIPEDRSDEANVNVLLSPVKCFPNPIDDEVNFQMEIKTETLAHLQIFDSLGKLVVEQETNLTKGVQMMDVENIGGWSKGLYFYTVRLGGDLASGKFVKQ